MSSLASDSRVLPRAAAKARGTAAVIEEARRRQRRRRRFGTLAAVGLAVIAGAGFDLRRSSPPSHTTIPTSVRPASSRSPSVTLYFKSDASRTAINNAIATATRERGVARVTFISKNTAFRTMRHRYPDLTAGLVFNPLTDSIHVRLANGEDPSNVVADLKRKHLPAVENISYRAAG